MRCAALLKPYIPRRVKMLVHAFYARLGAVIYGHPSESLIVIGVTGTSGKSSVCFFLRQMLEYAGLTVGALSTVEFYIAGRAVLNDRKMTMLGRMEIQKKLREMVDAGCNAAIVETTSEGVVQSRHKHINFDIAVLTNLYPEHIRSHGSFDNYREAKLNFFRYAAACRKKNIQGAQVPKTAVVGSDSPRTKDFLLSSFDSAVSFGIGRARDFEVKNISADARGISFDIHGYHFAPRIRGAFNAGNIAACIASARALGISWKIICNAVDALIPAPGRIEFISEAETRGFSAVVDYAFEPVALEKLYEVIREGSYKRIIHLTGNTGGGRDTPDKKAAVIAKYADIVIVANEDPYNDNPQGIIDAMAVLFQQKGFVPGKTLFKVLDRREAIAQALRLAKKGDAVLITGKGSEQKMCIKGGVMLDWDDRVVAREELSKC